MQFYTLAAFFCIFHLSVEIDEFYFKDLRREFLERRAEKRKQDIRLKLLDRISNSTTLIFEGILHILENKSNIEEAYKDMIIMKEAKYIYKRGFVWRTWRDVEIGGKRKIVHYKCSHIVKNNYRKCDGGYWVIIDFVIVKIYTFPCIILTVVAQGHKWDCKRDRLRVQFQLGGITYLIFLFPRSSYVTYVTLPERLRLRILPLNMQYLKKSAGSGKRKCLNGNGVS